MATRPDIGCRTLQIFQNAQQRCSAHGTSLLVLLLPTRESVYAHATEGPWAEEFSSIVEQETRVRTRLQKALHARGIRCLDVLPQMVAAVNTTHGVYADFDDGHPLAAGYKIYASAATQALIRIDLAQK